MSKNKPFSDKKFKDLLEKGTDWYSKEDDYEEIKGVIREYLSKINKGRCFFCKHIVNTGTSLSHIEHLVCQSKYKMFSYNPRNLTFICSECNRLKGDDEVFSKEELMNNDKYTYNDYPFHSSDYKIIHPYLDDYDEYIEIDEIFYANKNVKSDKGINTIIAYHLDRLTLAEDKIKGSTFINSFMRDLYENDGVNPSTEVDYCFTAGTLARYIDNTINPNDEKNNDLINKILKLNNQSMILFSQYRELSNELSTKNKLYFKNIIEKSDFYKNNDLESALDEVEDILFILSKLISQKDSRKVLATIIRFGLSNYSNNFKEYESRKSENKQLEISFNIKYVLEFLITYQCKNYRDEIKSAIGNDKRIFSELTKIIKRMDKAQIT